MRGSFYLVYFLAGIYFLYRAVRSPAYKGNSKISIAVGIFGGWLLLYALFSIYLAIGIHDGSFTLQTLDRLKHFQGHFRMLYVGFGLALAITGDLYQKRALPDDDKKHSPHPV